MAANGGKSRHNAPYRFAWVRHLFAALRHLAQPTLSARRLGEPRASHRSRVQRDRSHRWLGPRRLRLRDAPRWKAADQLNERCRSGEDQIAQAIFSLGDADPARKERLQTGRTSQIRRSVSEHVELERCVTGRIVHRPVSRDSEERTAELCRQPDL